MVFINSRVYAGRIRCIATLSFLLGVGATTCWAQTAWTAARPDGHAPMGILIDHTHKKGEWMVSYRYMHQSMRGSQQDTKSVSSEQILLNDLMAPKQMRMGMHMLMAMYGLTNRLTVMAMLNVATMQMSMTMLPSRMTMPGMTMNSGSMVSRSAGLNDTQLYALYTLAEWNQQRIMLSGGISLPTGSIQRLGNATDMYENQRLPYAMQLGSGSVDLLPGITYVGQRTRWSWGGQATGIVRTHYNTVGYRLGHELDLNGWLAYRWSRWISTSLRAESINSGAIQGVDYSLFQRMEPAADPANYGGQRISGYAGLNVYIRNGFFKGNRLAIEAGMPVVQRVNGIQMPLTSTLYVGWQRAF